jgi:hypothetical protein
LGNRGRLLRFLPARVSDEHTQSGQSRIALYDHFMNRPAFAEQKNLFLLTGALVTTLAGLLGCLFFGYFGIVAVLIGMLTATAPVGVIAGSPHECSRRESRL